jgi:hypothetical protein
VGELVSGAVDLREFVDRFRPDVVIYDLPRDPAAGMGHASRVVGFLRSRDIPCVLTTGDAGSIPDLRIEGIACVVVRPCDFELARLAVGYALGQDWERDDDDEDDSEEETAA